MELKKKLKQRLEKRKKRIRAKLVNTKLKHTVLIQKTNKHFHAQVYDNIQKKILGGITTNRKTFKPKGGYNSVESCKILAKDFAEQLKSMGISEIAYDRAGYRFHGKVKYFAETLKKGGIKI